MRLIDADALFKEFERAAWYNNADRDEIAEEILLQMPIIDAVPFVRCKDCCHSYDINGRWRCSHGICCGRTVPVDFYCAEGKRKENE